MKLYSLIIYNLQKELVYSFFNLGDIFILYRYKVKSLILDIAQNTLNILDQHILYKVNEDLNGHLIKVFCHLDGYYYIIISDDEYEDKILYQMLLDLKSNDLDRHSINLLCKDYNDNPQKHDKIKNINDDINETKVIMLNSIDKLLERGEKLDEINKRTEELRQISIDFNNKSIKMNSCCMIV